MIEKIGLETQVPRTVLMALYDQGVLALIPRNLQSEITSVGSIKHLERACAPCLFYHRGRCNKGILCAFCHIRHRNERIKRIRPSKRTREKMRREHNQGATPSDQSASVGASDGERDDDVEDFEDVGGVSAMERR